MTNTEPTPSTERQIASRYVGAFAWPTVVLFAALTLTYGAVVAAGVAGWLPLWVGLVVNALVAYAFYTVHHEANHGNISGSHRNLQWIDQVMGLGAAVPLTLSFRGFAPMHLLHHAHTNEPDKDPDALVAGPLAQLPVKWALQVFVLGPIGTTPVVGPTLAAAIIGRLGGPPPAEPASTLGRSMKRMRRFDQLTTLVLVIAFLAGFGSETLLLWWLPGKLAVLALMVAFQWLPHHPHTETDRYRNTRITVFAGSTPALLEQDHHLIHHLFPRVPWYRYRKLFRELRPILEENNARIEGRRLGPTTPAIALR